MADPAASFIITERERTRRALDTERERSEQLLHNILPTEVASRLKAGESLIAERINGVTILFADLVGSTSLSEHLSPDGLADMLNEIFTSFDNFADASSAMTCGA
jgi:class 3 adenylate cyclase